jgi:putative tryptophan/tyrosine transport system substrate-binding protein
MSRREFLAPAGVTVVWPAGVRAQQPEQVRRIGVLMNVEDDPEGQRRVAMFQQALQQLGWVDRRNIRIDIRWGANDVDRERRYASELAAFAPDVILAAGTLSVVAFQHVTRTLPIVFVNVSDPVGAGFVDSLSQPGRNVTGFMLLEYSSSGKSLELLSQIAPNVRGYP